MSTLRDDIIPVIDEGRRLADELGLRRQTVVIRTRTWSGSEVGRGTPTDVDLTLSPTPKVRRLALRIIAASGGTFEQGDRQVTKISATYDREQLDGSELTEAQELLWLINGEEHTLVGTPEEKNFEWRCVVRHRNR
ncbi:MAG: hypothetical protein AAFV53_27470 [Myxococcota bacterium]